MNINHTEQELQPWVRYEEIDYHSITDITGSSLCAERMDIKTSGRLSTQTWQREKSRKNRLILPPESSKRLSCIEQKQKYEEQDRPLGR